MPGPRIFLTTGQTRCYGADGAPVPCENSGQDGEAGGHPYPEPRFRIDGETAFDGWTGRSWTLDAAVTEFPLTWPEALAHVRRMNREAAFGHEDWRLPNRRELFSLVSHTRINPSLPGGHPFSNVFPGYYWTATTCARLPGQAWYVHLGGARVFKGMKHGSYMVWPVRGQGPGAADLLGTGQRRCYGGDGRESPCPGTGQDGESRVGVAPARPRFEVMGTNLVVDRATGLTWTRSADLAGHAVAWAEALERVKGMRSDRAHGFDDWRLPNIRELESLLHLGHHSPALPKEHPFADVREGYWSATTSVYDPAYAWVLYMVDGPVGVGYKEKPEFHFWSVR